MHRITVQRDAKQDGGAQACSEVVVTPLCDGLTDKRVRLR